MNSGRSATSTSLLFILPERARGLRMDDIALFLIDQKMAVTIVMVDKVIHPPQGLIQHL